MSSSLLLAAAARLMAQQTTFTETSVTYQFIFEDMTVHPAKAAHCQDWTDRIPKEYPFTRLSEGRTFEFEGQIYKVRVLKEGWTYGKKYYCVWFRKIEDFNK